MFNKINDVYVYKEGFRGFFGMMLVNVVIVVLVVQKIAGRDEEKYIR